jgi:hypothetical protein
LDVVESDIDDLKFGVVCNKEVELEEPMACSVELVELEKTLVEMAVVKLLNGRLIVESDLFDISEEFDAIGLVDGEGRLSVKTVEKTCMAPTSHDRASTKLARRPRTSTIGIFDGEKKGKGKERRENKRIRK